MMNCPHGKTIYEQSRYGINIYIHEDGCGCDLLNTLDTSCRQLANSYILKYINEKNIHQLDKNRHLMRIAYASYKVSMITRFQYIEFISSLSEDKFITGFEPIRLTLISEDECAANGLYLLELYFAFCGITKRITAVNDSVTDSPLYRFLSGLGVRTTVQESTLTRSYAHLLNTEFSHYRKAFTVPCR